MKYKTWAVPRRLVPAIAALLVFLIAVPAPLAAEATLFVSSNPLQAAVWVDGEPLDNHTPLLTRVAAGRRQITILDDRHYPEHHWITVSEGGIYAIDADLRPRFVTLAIVGEQSLRLNGIVTEHSGELLELPDAPYLVSRRGALVSVDPEPPWRLTHQALGLALPFLLGTTVLLSIAEIADPHPGTAPVAPGLIASAALSTSALSFRLALGERTRRYAAVYDVRPVDFRPPAEAAERLFAEAGRAMGAGEVREATELYMQLIEQFPTSVRVPESIFNSARLRYLAGETEAAVEQFRTVITRYPTVATYDRSAKTLADIYYTKGDYDQSLAWLDLMVYADDLFTPQDIESYRERIRRDQRDAEPAVLQGESEAAEVNQVTPWSTIDKTFPIERALPQYEREVSEKSRNAVGVHLISLGLGAGSLLLAQALPQHEAPLTYIGVAGVSLSALVLADAAPRLSRSLPAIEHLTAPVYVVEQRYAADPAARRDALLAERRMVERELLALPAHQQRYRRTRVAAFATAAVAAVGFAASLALGEAAYRRYNDAAYTSDARELRRSVDAYRAASWISAAAAIIGTGVGVAAYTAEPDPQPLRDRLREIDHALGAVEKEANAHEN